MNGQIDSHVQLVTDHVQLRPAERHLILRSANDLLQKHKSQFDAAYMVVHLKAAATNRRKKAVVCQANLVTDNGRYHAESIDWEPLQALDAAVEAIKYQIYKHIERENDRARMVYV